MTIRPLHALTHLVAAIAAAALGLFFGYALLNGLTVDYDLYIYNSTTGSAVASSTAGGTTAETATWTNTGASAVNVYVRVYRYSATKTTYQLRVSY